MIELFLDHANRDLILPLLRTGEYKGVTSNPEIMNVNGIGADNVREFASDVFEAGAETLCMQAWGLEADVMHDAGKKLASVDDRVIVKVPWTLEGRKAGLRLISDGIPVLATAVLTLSQVISAQAAGVTALSPYLDSMERVYGNSLQTLDAMGKIEGPGRMIVADVHSPSRISQVFSLGIYGVTTEPEALVDMCDVPAALEAAERFEGFNRDTNWQNTWKA